MNIDVVSDLHGFHPTLEGGDLLVIAGDLTARDESFQYERFFSWCSGLNYKKIILIGGNHDNKLTEEEPQESGCPSVVSNWMDFRKMAYLFDSGAEFEGLKIWGSPWTKTFLGMNPKCKAFAVDTESELAKKWALIPENTDLLVTHSPPYGIRDTVVDGEKMKSVGSTTLLTRIQAIRPKVVIFGHIHEAYGQIERDGITYINASHVNEWYRPVNKPIRIQL